MKTLAEQLDSHGVIMRPNKGVSMMPLLRENRDVMVIRKREAERLRKYDAVLFVRDNGEYVLHRILKVNPDSYWIVGDNCISGEIVREEQVIGILTEIVRDGKTIHVTDRGYLAFVHIWCALFPLRSRWMRCKGSVLSICHRLKQKLSGR
jgi:hypothetical protein